MAIGIKQTKSRENEKYLLATLAKNNAKKKNIAYRISTREKNNVQVKMCIAISYCH